MPTLGVDYLAQSSAKRVYGLGDCLLGVGFPLIHYCLLKSRQISKSVAMSVSHSALQIAPYCKVQRVQVARVWGPHIWWNILGAVAVQIFDG